MKNKNIPVAVANIRLHLLKEKRMLVISIAQKQCCLTKIETSV